MTPEPSATDNGWNDAPWPPVTNRATRRRCTHQYKTHGGITACAYCGTLLDRHAPEETT
jgi:hypothetical protein